MSAAAFEERAGLVLALARVLYVNGEATAEILALTGPTVDTRLTIHSDQSRGEYSP